jgi:hypothetical protein
MAARTAERARNLAEANEREDAAMAVDIHLHGTATACPCGAETGITCVGFAPDHVEPDPCADCGKPLDRQCDGRPWRTDITRHAFGCPEHPETPRCKACGGTMWDGAVSWAGDGAYHFREGCAPGVRQVYPPSLPL